MIHNLKEVLKNHPALVLSGSYFLTTAIGMVYSFIFFQEFGINILNFSDIGDFLLFSITFPVSILVFFAAIILVLLAYKIDSFFRRRFPIYGDAIQKFLKPRYTDPITYVATVLFAAIVYIDALAKSEADKIKNGEYSKYRVTYFGKDNNPVGRPLALLGGSTRYNYFYDPTASAIIIIPVSNILEMMKVP